MITVIVGVVVVFVVGFVAGVLLGHSNKNKVEAAVNLGKVVAKETEKAAGSFKK